MKIVNLQAENVKRLRAVEITPDGAVVTIGGRNAQGKSSILDSIEYALGGKPKVDRPIRDGQSSAKVVLETEDLIVTRTFSSSGSQLKVENRNGRKFSSPQAMLDKLYGSLTFDPLAFSRKNAKDQAEALRALTGIDLTELDRARQDAYDERTLVNREIKSIAAQVDAIPLEDVEPVSLSELTTELERRCDHNRREKELQHELNQRSRELDSYEEDLRSVRNQIQALQEKEAYLLEQSKKAEVALEEATAASQAFEELDTEGIRQQIADAEKINAVAAQSKRRLELCAQVQEKQAIADALTKTINEIDAEKQATLADASFPLDGLAFDENGVTMNGIPFQQCSSAEQLRISVAMGFAMNPELRVLLVREGSLLDSESVEIMRQLAEQHDGQLWIEKVSEDGAGCTVVIEDGAIKESEVTA